MLNSAGGLLSGPLFYTICNTHQPMWRNGRRKRLKIVRETVWVRLPSSAVKAFASGKGRNVHVPIFDRYPEGIELGPQVRARSFLFRDPLPHMTYISSDLWSELVFCFTSYRRYGRRRRPVPGRCMRSRSGNGRGFRRRSVHPGVPRRDASRPPVPR